MIILETERLILRTWQESDLQPMFEINQDPKVMEYFPSLQDLQTTKNFIAKISKHYDKYGYSLYVVELKATGEMIGFVGLLHRTKEEFDAPLYQLQKLVGAYLPSIGTKVMLQKQLVLCLSMGLLSLAWMRLCHLLLLIISPQGASWKKLAFITTQRMILITQS